MSMSEWAEREIEIACKREREAAEDCGFDYGTGCYQSALKAYKSLMKDGHSGFSFGFTRNILKRLLNELPLTPIEDTDDEWNEVHVDKNGTTTYQCKRMYDLFKYVDKDGNVKYSGGRKYYCFIKENPENTFSSGIGSRLMDELYPITFPYFPPKGQYAICMSEYLTDSSNGDYDVVAVWYIKEPDGKKVEINRFYYEKDGKFEEVSGQEFNEYVKMHQNRIHSEIIHRMNEDLVSLRNLMPEKVNNESEIERISNHVNSIINLSGEIDFFEHKSNEKYIEMINDKYFGYLLTVLKENQRYIGKLDPYEKCKHQEFMARIFYILRLYNDVISKED